MASKTFELEIRVRFFMNDSDVMQCCVACEDAIFIKPHRMYFYFPKLGKLDKSEYVFCDSCFNEIDFDVVC